MTERIEEHHVRGRELVSKLLAHPAEFKSFNDLLEQFVQGFPLAVLGELLQNPNYHVLACALFIADELGSKAAPVLAHVIPCLRHTDKEIRLSAYGVISSNLNDKSMYYNIVCGLKDPSRCCRKLVSLLMMRAHDSLLRAALDELERRQIESDLCQGLKMLLGPSARDVVQVQAWIRDDSELIRKFGVIAAGRLAEAYSQLLETASQSNDEEVREGASAHARFVVLKKLRNVER